ncbi:uncharacterized protein LOC129949403 [Eupeodes corollae]|uniref:uncharacterized protein LOC129949403 n=1 Tax=Eupeodes corollae TaxID=290404 RepID=UPI002490B8E9|nr:uncharacterized protein LOC129949403 [Eupeodes corollae]
MCSFNGNKLFECQTKTTKRKSGGSNKGQKKHEPKHGAKQITHDVANAAAAATPPSAAAGEEPAEAENYEKRDYDDDDYDGRRRPNDEQSSTGERKINIYEGKKNGLSAAAAAALHNTQRVDFYG